MVFPLVDAFLVQPEEGKTGKIGICTNSLAPTMVVNELTFEQRKDVAVLGSLVVNRDGAERMIVNCLTHPSIEYVILFGEETLSFKPSTNLLLALMNGYDPAKTGNAITGGKGVAHQYPSISPNLLDLFRKRIKILPLFTQSGSDEVVQQYLSWLKPSIPEQVFTCLNKIITGKKLYYDSLNELVGLLSKISPATASVIVLDPKEFQHLQPPIIEVTEESQPVQFQFRVEARKDSIIADIDFATESCTITGTDSFLMAYSIMHYAHQHNLHLPVEQQLYLGAELSRAEVLIRNNVSSAPFGNCIIKNTSRTTIPLQPRPLLNPDKKYYYRISVKQHQLSVQSLAHDTCESVFELRSNTLIPILKYLARENRFEQYEQEMLHRLDVGIEAGRAAIALQTNNSYFQDFRNLFTINTTKFPLFLTEADSFLANHQKMITSLYTNGISETHPDAHKGIMRAGTILATYREAGESLKHFPALYASGSQTVEDMRAQYKQELLSKECEGTYKYGNRTREHFGKDQLIEVAQALKKNPNTPVVIQRFDYIADMNLTQTTSTDSIGKTRTRVEATHDPCLSHDIYFLQNNKLHSFHIARAHNVVNAYPENIFGLHDAYDCLIADQLEVPLGDMFMLSSRANILLFNEEQKAKKLIAEPSKPIGVMDTRAGPHALSTKPSCGVAYAELNLEQQNAKPEHPDLLILENYKGINLIQKAINYLKIKGTKHNNPIIGTYDPTQIWTGRLVFFQCNQSGKELQATAVFVGGGSTTVVEDTNLCNYLSTQYSTDLELPLGKLYLFYAPVSV